MAIAIGVSSKGRTASASSIVTTGVATSASGSIIVGAMVFQGTFSSYVDNKSNTPYVQVDSERIIDTTNTAKLRMYHFPNAAGGASHTTTAATTTAQPITNLMAEITGGALVSVVAANNGVNDTSSPYGNLASITPVAGNYLLLAAFGGNSGSNPATQAETQGFTILTSAQELDGATFWSACLAYKLVTADGVTAYTAQFTESGASEGGVILAAFKELASTATSDGAVSGRLRLGKGPGVMRFAPATRGFANPATDLTIALSGQAIAISAGTLIPALSVAMSGQSLASSAGTLIPGNSIPLSGNALASALGTLIPASSIPLSGSAIASAQGTLAPSLSIALTGLVITIGQGNLSAPGNVTVALTGQQISSALGTLVPAIAKALTGSAIAAALGTVIPGTDRALTGTSLLSSIGALGPAMSVRLAGSVIVASQGTLTPPTSGDPTPPTLRSVTVNLSTSLTVNAPETVIVNAPDGVTVH